MLPGKYYWRIAITCIQHLLEEGCLMVGLMATALRYNVTLCDCAVAAVAANTAPYRIAYEGIHSILADLLAVRRTEHQKSL